MKKNIILILLLFTAINIKAQKIINVVLVGEDGVTDDVKKAESFIIVKKFVDYFERLDYKKAGPLIKSRSYKDSNLTVLNGNFYAYRPNGTILYSGKYSNNKKCENWKTYNDTGKVVFTQRYEDNVLVETVNLREKDSSQIYSNERNAEFPGGNKAWIKYIVKSLEKSEARNKSEKGGKVIVNFMVGETGEVQEVFIAKSVEFVLDEDAIEIIRKSPKWIPAWQNGGAVNAYRRQPIVYVAPQ